MPHIIHLSISEHVCHGQNMAYVVSSSIPWNPYLTMNPYDHPPVIIAHTDHIDSYYDHIMICGTFHNRNFSKLSIWGLDEGCHASLPEGGIQLHDIGKRRQTTQKGPPHHLTISLLLVTVSFVPHVPSHTSWYVLFLCHKCKQYILLQVLPQTPYT